MPTVFCFLVLLFSSLAQSRPPANILTSKLPQSLNDEAQTPPPRPAKAPNSKSPKPSRLHGQRNSAGLGAEPSHEGRRARLSSRRARQFWLGPGETWYYWNSSALLQNTGTHSPQDFSPAEVKNSTENLSCSPEEHCPPQQNQTIVWF